MYLDTMACSSCFTDVIYAMHFLDLKSFMLSLILTQVLFGGK